MKKRMISLLLTLCMVTALFSCLTVGASAADTITYTLQRGDTVLAVCRSLGIDFYANHNWIKQVNGITNFNTLPAGMTITLPAPGTVPGQSDLPGSTGGDTGGATGGTTGGTGSTTLQGGDTVSEYLVYHTMVAGDTVTKICASLGVSFAANSDRIMKLNNIKSYNRIPVGQVLLLPASTLPASGRALKVVAHRIASGETTTGICKAYGITYANYANLLKELNNRSNLNSIMAGQILYVPVPTTLGGGTGSAGNAGSSGNTGSAGNTGAAGSTGSAGSTEGVSGTYKITHDTPNRNQGKVSVASSARSGAVVTVTATPTSYYKLGGVTVTTADGKSVSVSIRGNAASFTMPTSDVHVSVLFVSKQDYTITASPVKTGSGSFSITLNGAMAKKASAGQTVCVNPECGYGYEVKAVKVTYKSGESDRSVKVSNDYTFIMPAAAVTVTVEFQKASSYSYELKGSTDKYTVTVNDLVPSAQKAMSGDVVKINPNSSLGSAISKISVVTTADGESVTVRADNTFIMPSANVTITVSFKDIPYGIYTDVPVNGSYTIQAGDSGEVAADQSSRKAINGVPAGTKVTITVKPDEGYALDSVTVTDNGKEAAKVTGSGNTGSFTMPEGKNVRITVKFKESGSSQYDGETYKVSVLTPNNNQGKLKAASTTARSGSTVTVTATPTSYYILGSVSVTDASGKTVAAATVSGNTATFTMPNCDVRVSATFLSKQTYAIKADKADHGSFTVTLNGAPANKASAGQTIQVNPECAFGYEVKEVKVTYMTGKTANAVDVSNDYTFVMPAYDVTIKVVFQPSARGYAITAAGGNTNTWSTKVNGRTVTEAKSGDTVTVTAANGYHVVSCKVVTTADSKPVTVSGNSFVMPSKAVTVNVETESDVADAPEETPDYSIFTQIEGSGSFTVQASGSTAVKASANGKTVDCAAGTRINIATDPQNGYELESIKVVSRADSSELDDVNLTVSGNNASFDMPDQDVTVVVTFKDPNASTEPEAQVNSSGAAVVQSETAPESAPTVDNEPSPEPTETASDTGDETGGEGTSGGAAVVDPNA